MSKVSRKLEYKKYPKPDEGIKQRIAGVKYLVNLNFCTYFLFRKVKFLKFLKKNFE